MTRREVEYEWAYVYAVFGPDGRPRYVGCTARPKGREKDHQRAHRSKGRIRNKQLHAWLTSLHEQGHVPVLRVIQVVPCDERRYAIEARWTKRLRARGYDLVNKWDGTARGHKFGPLSQEHRRKLSEWQKGKPLRDEHCRAISEGLRDYYAALPNELRAKRHDKRRGRELSPEHRAKVSEGRKRYWERVRAEQGSVI